MPPSSLGRQGPRAARDGDVAQLVDHRTVTLLAQVRSPDAARDCLPQVNFQCSILCQCSYTPVCTPRWGAADAEMKVPSGENTELEGSPFNAWSRSIYSHTCYAYCQGFLTYFYTSDPFTCISSKTSPDFFCVCCD